MKINKKVRNLGIIAGIMLGLAVGCSSTEETTTDTEVTPSNQKVEAAKGNDVIEEQETEVTEGQDKETVCMLIETTAKNSMGDGYQVDATIDPAGDCVITVVDKNNIYSIYNKEEIKATGESLGLPQIYIDTANSAKEVFTTAGFENVRVQVTIAGADVIPFLIVDSNGMINWL